MPSILITNNHLQHYAGSEMVTLELIEEFVTRGWDVALYANIIGAPVKQDLDRLVSTGKVAYYDNDDADIQIDFDLIWIHHSVLPPRIINDLVHRRSKTRVIWHHMSALPGLESALFPDIETQIADKITFVSPKTREYLTEYGLDYSHTYILPNPAPRPFLTFGRHEPDMPLKKLLLVSNHPPPEVSEALQIIEQRGLEVKKIGGSSSSRVTPDTFEDVDAVITIGKTVQYSLCLGVPVYVYDHFGGIGWLNSSNFELERETNFSGRASFRQATGVEICAELLSGFESARSFAQNQREFHQKAFGLQFHLDLLLKEIAEPSHPGRSLDPTQAKRWVTFAQIQRDSSRALDWERSQRIAQTQHGEELQKNLSDL